MHTISDKDFKLLMFILGQYLSACQADPEHYCIPPPEVVALVRRLNGDNPDFDQDRFDAFIKLVEEGTDGDTDGRTG